MKILYLVRHAKSSKDDPTLKDFDRPLSKRGLEDAPLMAKKFVKHCKKPTLLISSPAKRALETAKIFADVLNYPREKILENELIYESNISDLLEVVYSIPDPEEIIMIFGHNPSLTDLANFLSDSEIENIPTAGILGIKFEVLTWKSISKNSKKSSSLGSCDLCLFPKNCLNF